MAATAYVLIDEVKNASPTLSGQWGTSYDALFDSLILRASELVDRLTKRGDEVGTYDAPATATARNFDAEGGLYLPIDECVEVTAVSIRTDSGTTWTDLTATDYYTWPYNTSTTTGPIVRLDIDRRQGTRSTWPSGREAVKVAARWGYSDVPPGVVKEAVIVQVIRWLKRGEQMFADGSLVGDVGRLVYVQKLDPEVRTLLVDSGLVKKVDLF